uniref:IRF tryptophan pentad repeat domain-containing protein n=1 Tax=Sus scrofa TaxID=9823 RepID=A0A4X1SV93_PIG
MAGAGGPLRLRDWLVAQIESGRYPGLRWEDAGKTLFRIPWKHAAKGLGTFSVLPQHQPISFSRDDLPFLSHR